MGRRATAGRPCWPRRGSRRACCPIRSPDALLALLQRPVRGRPAGGRGGASWRPAPAALGVLVNVEDVLPLCDFHVPAIVRRGDLLLTASTGGQAPGLARPLRESLAEQFGPEWTGRLKDLGLARAKWRAAGPVARAKSPQQCARADRADGLAMSPTSPERHRHRYQARHCAPPSPARPTPPWPAHLKALQEKAGGPRRAWHSGTGADRRIRRQDRRRVVLRRGIGRAAESGGRDRSQHARSCSSTPASCSAKPCAIATGCRMCWGWAMCARWRPVLADRERNDPEGTLWSRDTDACCDFRKTMPLASARWSRSRRRSPAASVSRPASAPPCSRWNFSRAASASIRCGNGTCSQSGSLCRTHKLPRHPLVEDGYPSIGCMPCTRRVQAGEDYRAGRWSGLDKDECGIHLDRWRRHLRRVFWPPSSSRVAHGLRAHIAPCSCSGGQNSSP